MGKIYSRPGKKMIFKRQNHMTIMPRLSLMLLSFVIRFFVVVVVDLTDVGCNNVDNGVDVDDFGSTAKGSHYKNVKQHHRVPHTKAKMTKPKR